MYIDISTEEKKKEVYDLFDSFSYKKEIYEHYGVKDNTSNLRYLNKIAKEIGFDFSVYKARKIKIVHCKYCGKQLDNSRKTFCNNSCAASYNNIHRGEHSETTRIKIAKSLRTNKTKETFVKSKRIKGNSLKEKLYRNGLKERKCEICGLTEWNGKEIILQLHHINGDNKDNRLENLQILCPNCHSQTDNFCNKNRKQYATAQPLFCKECGKELCYTNKTGLCKDCYHKLYNQSKKPLKEIMIEDMKTHKSYSALARLYNVSSRTIEKWLIQYNIDF